MHLEHHNMIPNEIFMEDIFFYILTSFICTWYVFVIVIVYLSAGCPEFPLKEVKFHLDADSWGKKNKKTKQTSPVRCDIRQAIA